MTITHDMPEDIYSPQDVVKMIESRIKTEYKKHPTGDWEVIASQRIFSTMSSMGIIDKEKVK